jgi:uncharacterized membrane protein YgcG
MKTIFSVSIVCSAIFLSFTGRAESQFEHILNFDSRIEVQTNGALAVVETIKVFAAGNQIQHGIYRDFPQLYHERYGFRVKTGFTVQSVRRDGQPEDFHFAKRENGMRVYFGSAATMVSHGLHTYELTYLTDRQLGFFPDHDELYWNVTGNGWVFPMDAVTATVTLPSDAVATNLTAYTGAQGERGRDFTATNFANTARFATTRRLPSENGLTIVVAWQKGLVAPPSALAGRLNFLRDNLDFVFAAGGLLLVVAYYFVAWFLVGREPRRGVIIPRYAPPENFSPAAVRYLYRMGYDDRVFAATVLNLAVKGVIRIRQGKARFLKKVFTLVPAEKSTAPLSPEDEIIRSELVGDGTPLTLQQENCGTLQAARKKLTDQLAQSQKGIYFNNHRLWCVPGVALTAVAMALTLVATDNVPATPLIVMASILVPLFVVLGAQFSRSVIIILGGFVAVLGCLLAGFGDVPLWMVIMAVLFALANGICIILLRSLTPAGREILDQIEGFKMYLSVAEKDRLNLENPPERTPELFEMFLPYALALGVEQKWSEQFTDVLAAAGQGPHQARYSPVWFQGDSWNQFGATSFAGALGGSLAGAISSASTAPGSSSGGDGGGGGGGGGSSGGGGGGGGGGGW